MFDRLCCGYSKLQGFDMQSITATSDVEIIANMGCKINETVDYSNDTRDIANNTENDMNTMQNNWKEFESKFDDNLNYTVDEVLQKMVNEGEITSALTSMQDMYIFIGDSYGAPNGTSKGWAHYVQSYMANSGVKVITSSVGGDGFSRRSGQEDANGFALQLQDIISGLEEQDRNRRVTIVVAGGYNDRNETEANLKPQMQAFGNIAKTYFQNVIIKIAFIGNCLASNTQGTTFQNIYNGYSNYIFAASANGFGTALLSFNWMVTSTPSQSFMNDGFHPTDISCESLSHYIISYALGCDYGFNKEIAIEITPKSGITATINLAYAGANNERFINKAFSQIDLTTPVNGGDTITIGIAKYVSIFNYTTFTAFCRDTSGNYYNGSFRVAIQTNGDVVFALNFVKGTGFVQNINRISFQ